MNNAGQTRDECFAELEALRQRLRRLAQAEEERRRAATALRESVDRFSRIFYSRSVAICIATLAEGRFLDANNNFLRLHGFRREEVIGRTSLDLGIWPQPEDRQQVVREL